MPTRERIVGGLVALGPIPYLRQKILNDEAHWWKAQPTYVLNDVITHGNCPQRLLRKAAP